MTVPEEVLATAERVREALAIGGRAEVSIRSRATGEHVTLLLAAKRKRANGRGYLPRNSDAGRVGWADADKIDVIDTALEYPGNKVGAFGKRSLRFYEERGADRARVWAADSVIKWALGCGEQKIDAQAEVFLATRCSICGRKLTDPESVERGIGPECFSKRTGSRQAGRTITEKVAEIAPCPIDRCGGECGGNCAEAALAEEETRAVPTHVLVRQAAASAAVVGTETPVEVVEEQLREERGGSITDLLAKFGERV